MYVIHILLPVAMGPALATGLATAWQQQWSLHGLIALMAGVLAVYTGDRVIERGDQLRASTRLVMAVVSAGAAIVLAAMVLKYHAVLLKPVLYVGALAVAYPALKRIPVAKALAVGLAWAIAVAVLPFADQETPWYLLERPATWAVFMLVTAGTILCDFKDVLTDRQAHIPSLPLWLGEKWARIIAGALCLDAVWLAAWDQAFALWLPCFALLILAMREQLLRRLLWGPIAVDAALCTPALAWTAGLLAL